MIMSVFDTHGRLSEQIGDRNGSLEFDITAQD